jgi:hypothetical protein
MEKKNQKGYLNKKFINPSKQILLSYIALIKINKSKIDDKTKFYRIF